MAKKSVDVKDVLGGKRPEKKPKRGKRAKHPRSIIDHLDDGSHVVTHEQHPPDDGSMAPPNVKYSARDLAGLKDALEQHLGEPNVAEEQANV